MDVIPIVHRIGGHEVWEMRTIDTHQENTGPAIRTVYDTSDGFHFGSLDEAKKHIESVYGDVRY